jgi:hypothetical protein
VVPKFNEKLNAYALCERVKCNKKYNLFLLTARDNYYKIEGKVKI